MDEELRQLRQQQQQQQQQQPPPSPLPHATNPPAAPSAPPVAAAASLASVTPSIPPPALSVDAPVYARPQTAIRSRPFAEEKYGDLPTFTGDQSTAALPVQEWLTRAERFFAMREQRHGIDALLGDEDRLKSAVGALADGARRWYDRLAKPPSSWRGFRNGLLARFTPQARHCWPPYRAPPGVTETADSHGGSDTQRRLAARAPTPCPSTTASDASEAEDDEAEEEEQLQLALSLSLALDHAASEDEQEADEEEQKTSGADAVATTPPLLPTHHKVRVTGPSTASSSQPIHIGLMTLPVVATAAPTWGFQTTAPPTCTARPPQGAAPNRLTANVRDADANITGHVVVRSIHQSLTPTRPAAPSRVAATPVAIQPPTSAAPSRVAATPVAIQPPTLAAPSCVAATPVAIQPPTSAAPPRVAAMPVAVQPLTPAAPFWCAAATRAALLRRAAFDKDRVTAPKAPDPLQVVATTASLRAAPDSHQAAINQAGSSAQLQPPAPPHQHKVADPRATAANATTHTPPTATQHRPFPRDPSPAAAPPYSRSTVAARAAPPQATSPALLSTSTSASLPRPSSTAGCPTTGPGSSHSHRRPAGDDSPPPLALPPRSGATADVSKRTPSSRGDAPSASTTSLPSALDSATLEQTQHKRRRTRQPRRRRRSRRLSTPLRPHRDRDHRAVATRSQSNGRHLAPPESPGRLTPKGGIRPTLCAAEAPRAAETTKQTTKEKKFLLQPDSRRCNIGAPDTHTAVRSTHFGVTGTADS